MKVERIEIATVFGENRDILLSCGPILQTLAAKLKGKINTLNVPGNAPPEIPRAVVQFENLQFQIAFTRFQFVMQPPAHVVSSPVESLSFAENKVQPILSALAGVVDKTYEWTGVIMPIEFPLDMQSIPTVKEAHAPIFRRLTTLNWDPEAVVAFNFQAGYKVGNYYRNYSVSAYEAREMAVTAPARTKVIQFDLSKASIAEVGITVTLDVNSRPVPAPKNLLIDVHETIEEHARACSTLIQDVNLQGVVS